MAFVYSIQNEPSERSNEVRIKDVEDKGVTSPSLVGPQEVQDSGTRENLCELFADETPLRDSVPREMSEDPEHLVPLPGNPESLPTETLLEITSKECYDQLHSQFAQCLSSQSVLAHMVGEDLRVEGSKELTQTRPNSGSGQIESQQQEPQELENAPSQLRETSVRKHEGEQGEFSRENVNSKPNGLEKESVKDQICKTPSYQLPSDKIPFDQNQEEWDDEEYNEDWDDEQYQEEEWYYDEGEEEEEWQYDEEEEEEEWQYNEEEEEEYEKDNEESSQKMEKG